MGKLARRIERLSRRLRPGWRLELVDAGDTARIAELERAYQAEGRTPATDGPSCIVISETIVTAGPLELETRLWLN